MMAAKEWVVFNPIIVEAITVATLFKAQLQTMPAKARAPMSGLESRP